MNSPTQPATRRCTLCACSLADEPRTALKGALRLDICPACGEAARPTRSGLEQAIVIVAEQHLAVAEELPLGSASTEQMAYHFTSLKRSLRSVLQLFQEVTVSEVEKA